MDRSAFLEQFLAPSSPSSV
ncbi:hypothetical protein F383_38178 [Gossypium arboreum]|uniref:Uncharacterized protein n=1 Tax=Gossypium arboreum TaxID=29729 RepID=A0A0B0MFG3_GOSAR|nr:hypothetical protein F383_38178 [Gossypium arboreum]